MSMQDGIRAVQHAFGQAATPLRWPMYVRQAKQYLRTSIEGFDERKYGFASVVDLLRAAGKEGVLRIERDRQGAVRVFPGVNLGGRPTMPVADVAEPAVDAGMDDAPIEAVAEPVGSDAVIAEPVDEPPIVDVQPIEAPQAEFVTEATPAKKGTRGRRAPAGRTAKTAKTKTAKPAAARKRTRAKTPATASDQS